jgi:inhibitor of cysteine peptidase
MKTTNLLSYALMALIFTGCATSKTPTKTLTAFDDNKQLTVVVGQTFVVELPSNPTTGYRWNYRLAGGNVVEQIGEPFFQVGAAPVGTIGNGGTEYFTFRATQLGRQSLRMEYERSWEKDVAPAKIVNYEIIVGVATN